jgi:RNA polymerase nonessential primary-like sigma factor
MVEAPPPEVGGRSDDQLLADYLADIVQYPAFDPGNEPAPDERRLIQAYLQMAASIAGEYAASGIPMLDLIQEANLGLMHAVQRYDPAEAAGFDAGVDRSIRQQIEQAVALRSPD